MSTYEELLHKIKNPATVNIKQLTSELTIEARKERKTLDYKQVDWRDKQYYIAENNLSHFYSTDRIMAHGTAYKKECDGTDRLMHSSKSILSDPVNDSLVNKTRSMSITERGRRTTATLVVTGYVNYTKALKRFKANNSVIVEVTTDRTQKPFVYSIKYATDKTDTQVIKDVHQLA